ncbi:hypothetical protein [Providencia sp.]|uniref:hypothetical protein n=1 Tax=Providencia sp. TaxID=589 RepID=UPI00333EAE35
MGISSYFSNVNYRVMQVLNESSSRAVNQYNKKPSEKGLIDTIKFVNNKIHFYRIYDDSYSTSPDVKLKLDRKARFLKQLHAVYSDRDITKDTDRTNILKTFNVNYESAKNWNAAHYDCTKKELTQEVLESTIFDKTKNKLFNITSINADFSDSVLDGVQLSLATNTNLLHGKFENTQFKNCEIEMPFDEKANFYFKNSTFDNSTLKIKFDVDNAIKNYLKFGNQWDEFEKESQILKIINSISDEEIKIDLINQFNTYNKLVKKGINSAIQNNLRSNVKYC